MKKLKVLFAAAEAAGLVKVGGLGDVAGELPLKLKEMGADVRLAIPAYRGIGAAARVVSEFTVKMGAGEETCALKETDDTRVPALLVGNDRYFDRPSVYGYSDDAERFAFFCLAVFQWIRDSGFKPDIIHLNDWHTAPLAMLVREREDEVPHLSGCALVFTIHSLVYQGICGREIFEMYGVGDAAFGPDGVEFYGSFNPMKAGIVYSDRFNAVSAAGAREMTTRKFGYGLEGFIGVHRQRLSGIPNGIDHNVWNPETDPALFRNYSVDDHELKRENKKQLQKQLGLERKDTALFGVVSRLEDIKGTDLLIPAAGKIAKSGCQLVVLGRGSSVLERALKRLEEENPGRISVSIGFDDVLARRIYAASDMFLMPSRYEPCGIGQLIAMRYGSVPIVHRVGGLADTVRDEAANSGEGTGFTFGVDSAAAFTRAISKGIKMYKNDRPGWKKLVRRAMDFDSSWDRSAESYLKLYEEAVASRASGKKKRGGATG
ncbi:MAG: glycogen synthase [Clostridiaceae bacterium]|nr:glycogen synthase [Clostridiaceae bacterium]